MPGMQVVTITISVWLSPTANFTAALRYRSPPNIAVSSILEQRRFECGAVPNRSRRNNSSTVLVLPVSIRYMQLIDP